MKPTDPIAIVQPAVTLESMRREASANQRAIDAAERSVKAHTEGLEKASAQHRAAMLQQGRYLRSIRGNWPSRGPGRYQGKTWAEFLADAGVDDRSALEWIALADHEDGKVSAPNRNGAETPTGIATRREVQEARSKPAPRVTREVADDVPPDDVEEIDLDEEEEEPRARRPRATTDAPGAPRSVTVNAGAGSTVQIAATGARVAVQAAAPTTDALGRPLSPALAEVWRVAGPRLVGVVRLLQEAARELGAQQDELREAKEAGRLGTEGDGLFHDAGRMATALRSQAAEARLAQPHAVCPYCEGGETPCPGCKGARWLSAGPFESAPAKLRERAKQKALPEARRSA